jgi:hypothetical protein
MAIFNTPTEMFKAIEAESKNNANAEYYKYKNERSNGYSNYAKVHYSKSQELYEIARLQEKLSVLFSGTSWQDLQVMFNNLQLSQNSENNS